MNSIIQSTIKTLRKSQVLLDGLTNEQFSDTSVSPYYSSIGSHLRHILDFYDCIFNADEAGTIDLTARSRNKQFETNCDYALDYLNQIIGRLSATKFAIDGVVMVVDDLGMGKIEIGYTYGALLAQANSHTVHHYAIINYIFDGLGIMINDCEFGYNATTPKPLNTD